VRRSDLALALLAVVVAVALFLVVRGERRVAATYSVPVVATLPKDLAPDPAIPSEVSVAISGPWARLRTLDPSALVLRAELSRTGAGVATWYLRSEALHLPRGLRVDAIHPAQGSVELHRAPVEGAPTHP
jgi:hypothetical protein